MNSSHVGTVAHELSTETYWVLTSAYPVEWKEITGAGSSGGPTINQRDINDNSVETIAVGTTADRFIKIEYEIETRVSSYVQAGTLFGTVTASQVVKSNTFDVTIESLVDTIEMELILNSSIVDMRITTSGVGENITIRYTVTSITGV